MQLRSRPKLCYASFTLSRSGNNNISCEGFHELCVDVRLGLLLRDYVQYTSDRLSANAYYTVIV
jgi:hypothetical protein